MVSALVYFLGGFISYHGLLAGNLIVAMAPISGERSTGVRSMDKKTGMNQPS